MMAILVEASVRAALVAGVIGLVLAVLRVRAGGVRHRAWTAVLGAMLLMPVLPSWLPAIPIAMPVVTSPGPFSETLGRAEIGAVSGAVPRAPVPVAPDAAPASRPGTVAGRTGAIVVMAGARTGSLGGWRARPPGPSRRRVANRRSAGRAQPADRR